MKIAKIGTFSIAAILFWASYGDTVCGQTAPPSSVITATAHIPFDFWIEGNPLPAGDYSISVDGASVVVFWNKKANIGQHAFLIPTGQTVTSKDYSLLFIVHAGKHYLRAIWCSEGIEIPSSQFDVSPVADDTETTVRLRLHTSVIKAAQGQE